MAIDLSSKISYHIKKKIKKKKGYGWPIPVIERLVDPNLAHARPRLFPSWRQSNQANHVGG